MMKQHIQGHVSVLFCLILLMACTQPKTDFSFDKSKVKTYTQVLKTLNEKQYVQFYREFKATNKDLSRFQSTFNLDEDIFLKDSTIRQKALNEFYSFDRKFINWLLHFESDTIVDGNSKKTALWLEYESPFDKKITLCMYSTPKCDQAVNIMYAWLRKSEFQCLGCSDLQKICRKKAYAGIKSFLSLNEVTSAEELQKAWSNHVKKVP